MADNWDSITPSFRPNGGRNSIVSFGEGRGFVLRAPRGLDSRALDARRRGNSEGGTHSRMFSLATPLVAKPPPRAKLDRKLASEKSVKMADRSQELLFDAKELDAEMEDVALWVHAHVVPMRWRRQVLAHLEPIHRQMKFCREELVRGWKLLHPPFQQPNLDSYERKLELFQRSVQLLSSAVDECKSKLRGAEALAACRYIQLWTRRLLAKRGFYTKVIKLSYHHRGIVSGMFDSIPGNSKLTVHRPTQDVTLEYPRSEKNWDSFG